MPRQDGPNGNIKGYKLEVSVDGENWSLVAEGEFQNNADKKTVLSQDRMHFQRILRLHSARCENCSQQSVALRIHHHSISPQPSWRIYNSKPGRYQIDPRDITGMPADENKVYRPYYNSKQRILQFLR